MKILWIAVGLIAGGVSGTVLSFVIALIAMSLHKSHNDGSDGMREMIVCLPAGLIIGLVAGLLWGAGFLSQP